MKFSGHHCPDMEIPLGTSYQESHKEIQLGQFTLSRIRWRDSNGHKLSIITRRDLTRLKPSRVRQRNSNGHKLSIITQRDSTQFKLSRIRQRDLTGHKVSRIRQRFNWAAIKNHTKWISFKIYRDTQEILKENKGRG